VETESATIAEITNFVYDRFAEEVGLARTTLLEGSVTLADVVQRSAKIGNSVDLMECFARTSNALRRQYGVRVRLPAYPVNTSIKTLMDSFVEQVQAQLVRGANA
jgi:hypothetical protein